VKRALGAIAAVVTMLAIAPRADASPLFELVGDPLGDGGLTARVSASDASAAYFNPALLTEVVPGLDLGVMFIVEEIGVTLDGRSSSPLCADGACDVPSQRGYGPESFRHEDSGLPIEEPTLPTDWLQDGREGLGARPRQGAGSGHQNRAYQTLGLVTQVFRGKVSLGLFAMIPLGEFTTAKSFYNDEREQYFSNSLHPELYGDRLTATSLAFGAGFKLRPELALGATFTLSLANNAAAPVYVSNINDLNTVLLDSDIAVQASVSPHFGAVWMPKPGARVAATVHTPQKFEIETGFNYVLSTGQEQSTTLSFTHSYMPLTVAAGGTYPLGAFSVRGVAGWARWSHYHDRHDELPGGEYPWSDTISGALGGGWQSGQTRAWLDLTYQPSPVPPQTGRTNYVDTDRAGLSAGADHRLFLWGSKLRIGVDVLAHRLFDRHVTKFPGTIRDEIPDDAVDVQTNPVEGREGLQTNNPGFPGWGVQGWILGGSVHVAVEY
jgi:long-chain fatty acid transport protein